MHLSDDRLQRWLRFDETDLLVEDSMGSESHELTHLEECPECQARLAALSGEGTWFKPLSGELQAQACAELMPESWESGEPGTLSKNTETISGDSPSSTEAFPLADVFAEGWSPSITVTIGLEDDHEAEQERREFLGGGRIPTDFLPPAAHPELLGRLGRYDIEETIGAGGFGIVFKAYDTELRRVVALKVLAPHLMSSAPARKRFAREAQAAAAIVHEHVIPIYDVICQPDACYLVMQYIPGHSLQERIERDGPLDIPELLRVGAQIAAGLRAAHQQGLVHRDVKPANILLEQSVERVLISDFGLARSADDANLTRSGAITGTPHYMSPEQASGTAVDSRSDLFSLGSVLYFACTGRPAFRAPQIVAVLNRICHFPHRRVNEVCAEIPGPVADLIDRLLAKHPDERFQTADEVEHTCRRLLADWQSGRMVALASGPSATPSSLASIAPTAAAEESFGNVSSGQSESHPSESHPMVRHTNGRGLISTWALVWSGLAVAASVLIGWNQLGFWPVRTTGLGDDVIVGPFMVAPNTGEASINASGSRQPLGSADGGSGPLTPSESGGMAESTTGLASTAWPEGDRRVAGGATSRDMSPAATLYAPAPGSRWGSRFPSIGSFGLQNTIEPEPRNPEIVENLLRQIVLGELPTFVLIDPSQPQELQQLEFYLEWSYDSNTLGLEIENTSRQWAQQNQDLEIWLELNTPVQDLDTPTTRLP